ncbi:hypothetical protein KM1_033100 [Entamoeba histolytica HM-3:IMSS]|uniref:Uncharacterized protein n=1 Tax=Entamoeba histolytica HM-3:IMSS TaxID=885315 RepID=M7XCE1_ENTHI|nr:hypothetical protein KM1_033100 [Entamoeba histolytica HM-3:IMSS]
MSFYYIFNNICNYFIFKRDIIINKILEATFKDFKRRNADAKTNDCLIKIASDYCWACFEFKKGKQSVVCSQMKRIQNAQIGSKIYGSNLILQEGKKMNQHILSIMSSHGCILSPQQSLVKC